MSKNHYVDNKKFYEEMKKRVEEIKDIPPDARPPISNYLGKCIYDICNHISYKPNFINYSYRSEMIGDALENCIRAVDNFNPEKSTNPFAYFTQIAFFAFLRRIDMEKKQQYVKFKMLEEIPADEMIEIQDHDGGDSQYRSVVDYMREHSYFDTQAYEAKKDAKKKKTVIEEVMETSE